MFRRVDVVCWLVDNYRCKKFHLRVTVVYCSENLRRLTDYRVDVEHLKVFSFIVNCSCSCHSIDNFGFWNLEFFLFDNTRLDWVQTDCFFSWRTTFYVFDCDFAYSLHFFFNWKHYFIWFDRNADFSDSSFDFLFQSCVLHCDGFDGNYWNSFAFFYCWTCCTFVLNFVTCFFEFLNDNLRCLFGVVGLFEFVLVFRVFVVLCVRYCSICLSNAFLFYNSAILLLSFYPSVAEHATCFLPNRKKASKIGFESIRIEQFLLISDLTNRKMSRNEFTITTILL